jgi:hypothetical protein
MAYCRDMPQFPKKKAAKARSWRVSIINEKAAEAAAVAEFDLTDEQRRRLVVQERN